MSNALKQRITDDMKKAMKAKDVDRLKVIRLMLAAIKQREIDERIELDDSQILATLDKMVKQRRDSIKQFSDAGRGELSAIEQQEIDVIQHYLPEPLSEQDILNLVSATITGIGASSMADMGKIMEKLKPAIQGRADMGKVSALVKSKLT